MLINPYKIGSRGAKEIKNSLRDKGVKCWILQKTPQNSRSLIVNWGNSQFDYNTNGLTIINHPDDVYWLSNKLKFFDTTGGSTDVLEWTKNRDTALGWGGVVFARKLVEASGGRGIVVYDPEAQPPGELPQAPLYTRYVPKTHEYRLHVARSLSGKDFTILLAQRKVFVKRHPEDVPKDWKIRSHDNGFIFQTHPTTEKIPAQVLNVTRRVMTEFFPKLHFAALDVMYHDKRNKAWVIEGNSAPGLENSSIGVYADYFAALEKEHKQCQRTKI